jgi:methionyl-tRNA formyltransferase
MGTPEFAVASLSAIHESQHEVVCVVTAPDRPSGRGKQVKPSPVKEFALKNGLPVLQPLRLKDEAFIQELKSYHADLFIVVAFRMLPEIVWSIPPLGTINLHASLLPQYRGAAPINWAIVNGEKETGVTTFFINNEIDTGDLIAQQRVAIQKEMNAGQLHDQLMLKGAELITETIKLVAEGKAQGIPQSKNEAPLKSAPKLNKENTRIDWQQPADSIVQLIRGMSPYPGAFAVSNPTELPVKLLGAEKSDFGQLQPGEIQSDGKKSLIVGTGNGSVSVTEIQWPGKRKMSIADFLNGGGLNHLNRFE